MKKKLIRNIPIIIGIFFLVIVILGLAIRVVRSSTLIISDSELQENLAQSFNIKIVLDKNVYFQNEKIKITIQNNYDEPIFIPGALAIEKIYMKDDVNWIILDPYCKYPYCIYDLPGPEVIESSDSKEIEWIPFYFIERDSKSLKPGKYIISIYFRFDLNSPQGKDWKQAYSEEFVIL